MPTLHLLRHAKTESANPDGDKARALTDRGRADAREVGAALRERGVERVLCSSATRTRQTCDELGLDAPVEVMDALYNTDVATMAQRIGETDDAVASLLVIGHSPTIPALAAELIWATQPQAADAIACDFPTAAWAEITFDGRWSDVPDLIAHGSPGSGSEQSGAHFDLSSIRRPRDVV